MQVEIKGNDLVITIPMQKPAPSASGKTLVVATTSGFKPSEAETEGKKIAVSVNAIIKI